MSQFFIQPQGVVGVAEVEEAARDDATEEEVVEVEVVGPEVEEDAPPGPIAIAPQQDAEVELRYPQCDRHQPDRLSMGVPIPQERRRKK